MPSGDHDGDSSDSLRARHDLRVVAVRIGDHQRIGRVVAQADRGDVGDARPERAAHAGDLLVDLVGDLVRHAAQVAGRRGERLRQQTLLLVDVPQLVLDAQHAAAGIADAPDGDVILLEQAPGRELDVRALRRGLHDVALGQRAELAGAVEIVAHHVGHVGRQRRAAGLGERHHHDRRGGLDAADDVDIQRLGARRAGEQRRDGQQDDGEA